MMVSTMPMAIQPISAKTSGRARCSIGGISRRMDMGGGSVFGVSSYFSWLAAVKCFR